MMRLDLCQMLQPFNKISCLAKHVFPLLRCRVGYLGKGTKSGNISEKFIIERSQITPEHLSLCHKLCRMTHDLWNPQTGSKIIDRTCRNVSTDRLFMEPHHTICHFIHRAVSTGAYHIIIPGAVLDHCVFGIILTIGCHQRHNKISFAEHLNNVSQFILDLLLPRHGIIDK